MTSHVAHLLKVIAPPTSPANATGDWEGVEQSLGFRLPADYKELIGAFGLCTFFEFMWMLNPFATPEGKSFPEVLESFRTAYSERARAELAYPVYPEPGGLVPCGATDNGDVISWIPEGDADEWRIMVYIFSINTFFELDGKNLSGFLLGLATQDPSLVPEVYDADLFTPDRLTAVAVTQ